MKITVNINGTDYEGNVEPTASRKSESETTKTGFERAKLDNKYYSVLSHRIIPTFSFEGNHEIDRQYFISGNYFSDAKLAADYRRVFLLFLKLSRWQAEHDDQPDLKSGFYIRYNYETKNICTAHDVKNDDNGGFGCTGTSYRGLFEIAFQLRTRL